MLVNSGREQVVVWALGSGINYFADKIRSRDSKLNQRNSTEVQRLKIRHKSKALKICLQPNSVCQVPVKHHCRAYLGQKQGTEHMLALSVAIK